MSIIKNLGFAIAITASLSLMAQPPKPSQTPPPGAGPHKAGPHHERMTPEMRANRWVDHMGTQLTITDDQKAKLREIITKREEQRMSDRQANNGNREGLRKAAHARHGLYEPQIKSVLTPEQYAKLEQMRKERKEKREQHKASQPAPVPAPLDAPTPVDDDVDEF